jgi:hypothetical protein
MTAPASYGGFAGHREHALRQVRFVSAESVIQGDPQHRNALWDGHRTVLREQYAEILRICDLDDVDVQHIPRAGGVQ